MSRPDRPFCAMRNAGELYYADTSAVIKLLVEETDSKAFAAFYDAHADA
jgi:predicted nucleic acid-binding protein